MKASSAAAFFSSSIFCHYFSFAAYIFGSFGGVVSVMLHHQADVFANIVHVVSARKTNKKIYMKGICLCRFFFSSAVFFFCIHCDR